MSAECDNNNDGNIDECEIFNCVLNVENEWRHENCPWFSDLYCVRDECIECAGEWNCDDLV